MIDLAFCEMVTSYQSMKVFSLESFMLYGMFVACSGVTYLRLGDRKVEPWNCIWLLLLAMSRRSVTRWLAVNNKSEVP